MSSGSAGDMYSLHPGVFILKWFLCSQQPAECHVQTICFRKWAGQRQPGFNTWAGSAVKAWELRMGFPHRTNTTAYDPRQSGQGVTSDTLKHLLAQSLYGNWGLYPAAAGPACLWVQASADILGMWGTASPFPKQTLAISMHLPT